MSTQKDQDDVVAVAREEAQRMLATVESVDAERTVTMKVAQFRKLAQLIDGLARAAEQDGRFDAPIDGIRFWVPLPYLASERARYARMMTAPRQADGADRFAF